MDRAKLHFSDQTSTIICNTSSTSAVLQYTSSDMTTFWDLPRPVRDKIYRMSLVFDRPVTPEEHHKIVQTHDLFWVKHEPPLCRVSRKADKEAAPIYFSENEFDLGSIRRVWCFSGGIYTRHIRLIRKLTCQWDADETGIGYAFEQLRRMTGLTVLRMRVNEVQMVARMLHRRDKRQRPVLAAAGYTSQEQLAVLRLPGMAGLLSLPKIRGFEFIKMLDADKKEHGGPIAGGALETEVLPRLRGLRFQGKKSKKRSKFDFLGLPAELRNHIYEMLLRIPGSIHPSTQAPTTSVAPTGKSKANSRIETNHSVLSLLGVSKQIYDEAVGIFYNNSLIFYYPTQLCLFLANMGPQRLLLIRDITIHYHNINSGGVELVEIAFSLLRQLKGLRKVHILMTSDPTEKVLRRHWYTKPWHRGTSNFSSANPGLIPGMKILFSLRGIKDIMVRDVKLEEIVKELEENEAFPDFPGNYQSHMTVKIAKALEHVNAALADAQEGRVNTKLLEDTQWQTWDVFPTLEHDGTKNL